MGNDKQVDKGEEGGKLIVELLRGRKPDEIWAVLEACGTRTPMVCWGTDQKVQPHPHLCRVERVDRGGKNSLLGPDGPKTAKKPRGQPTSDIRVREMSSRSEC
jgi:hypothetical protein